MAVLHAAAIFVDELANGDTGRGRMHAGIVDAARNRKRAQALAAVPALLRKPRRALFDDVAYPVERLHVVLERGPPEETDLRDVRRPKPRHSPLALDRFDHR